MSPHKSDNLKTVITQSRALAVIGIVLVVNLLLSFFDPFGKTTIAELPKDHSWISWTTQDFVNQPSPPDVVFVGSSLLLHPLAMLDSDHLNRKIDYAEHHRSAYAEDRIAQKMGIEKPICFNFAMPGGMISDDWIIVESILKGHRKPKVLVLGTCARDFMDNKVRCPGVTPTFKYLSKVIDLEPILDLALPNFADRTDFAIGKIAYLWDVKPAVQDCLSENARITLEDLSIVDGGNRFTPKELDALLTADMSSELERGMMVEEPGKARPFADNTGEYAERYKARHENLFNVEKQFFDKLLATANANDIRVVVVNMPLTSLNVKMMPKGTYDEYLDTVRSLTSKYGCVFADLNDDTKFPSSLFYDTVHMNSNGGKRLMDAVVDLIYSDKICTKKLSGTNDRGIASGGGDSL